MVNVNRIRNAAALRGVKLGKICELLGEKSNYLGKVERGIRKMSDAQVRTVAEFLRVEYDYLMDQSDYLERHTYFSDAFNNLQPKFDPERAEERRISKHLTPGYVMSCLNMPEYDFEGFLTNADRMPPQMIHKLAIILDTTYEYLMGLTDDPGIPINDKDGVKIRVFGDVAAGIPIQQIDNFDPEDADSWEEINRKMARGGVYFALRIKGDSMEPRMFAGDVVIVRYQQEIESGDIAIVAINGDEATCKKITLTSDGIILNSLNPKYEPRFLSSAAVQKLPVRILGKVVEVRGKL